MNKEIRQALSKALRALCLTRDYVGNDLLPARSGWEWYDAGILIVELIPDDDWSVQFNLRVKEYKDAHPNL